MKPHSETSKGWNTWHEEAKKSHPFRYWLAEEGLDIVQDAIYYVPDKFYEARSYFRNRYRDNTHALTSKLPRGKWYDMDTRILHCMFDSLVTFVDEEKALRNYEWFEKNNVKFKVPCAEAGLAHLAWEINLKHDEEWVKKSDPEYGKTTHQAKKAKEILALYTWWTKERPLRPDPMDVSGWSKLCDESREKNGGKDIFLLLEEESKKDRARSKKVLDKCHKIEEAYDKEDEEMLIRLIKIRKSLWT
jgi:hypothetical protein